MLSLSQESIALCILKENFGDGKIRVLLERDLSLSRESAREKERESERER